MSSKELSCPRSAVDEWQLQVTKSERAHPVNYVRFEHFHNPSKSTRILNERLLNEHVRGEILIRLIKLIQLKYRL